MPYLQQSGRCKLFEEIAAAIWSDVSAHHSVNVEAPETGITNRIITEIRIAHTQNQNIGVWANNGWREIDHGSDIDVFVETVPGWFVWWALQAKVLKVAGHYDVKKPAGEEQQWTKLVRLSDRARCNVRYLLYNGVAAFTHQGQDACSRHYTQEQFGCSLVHPSVMERVANAGTPVFADFHPKLAQPWRIITCCSYRPGPGRLYSTAVVKDSIRYYQPDAGNTTMFQKQQPGTPNEPIKRVSDLQPGIIDRYCAEVDRVPSHRIVIRTTASLAQEKETEE